LLPVIGLTGCSDYQKLLKSNDYEKKYETAVNLYEEGDYYRALQLFDQVIPVFRGKDRAEDLFYYYAYSYYNQGDNVMASYYFKRFAKSYPNSSRAEEAWYMSAYCKFLESPRYSLDQTNTHEAINELQAFANRHPNSERLDKVNELIDKLRAKLEKKNYEQAKLYFKMEEYQAAIVSFNNLLKNYPDTEFREESLFNILEAKYIYAKNSVSSKQPERYQEAIEAYDRLVSFYPDTEYKKKARKYQEESQTFISQ
jgi:outer membrane protein assembly factor BamD